MREIGDSNSYTLYAYLFEIAAGLVSEHDAEFMDALQYGAQIRDRGGPKKMWMDFTSRNSFDVVDTWRNFAKRVFTRG